VLLYAEIPVRTWQALGSSEKIFKGISRFPIALRDISLVGPKDVSFARLKQVIEEAGAPLLLKSELFDVYTTGEEKSFALHLGFGSPERTLSSSEMDEKFDSIVREAGEHLNMKLKL
jgi:phenylalanyl-tRNA synthetase beta subunit